MRSFNTETKKFNAAVTKQRLYHGSQGCPIKVQQKLMNAANRAINNLGWDIYEAYEAVVDKANALGPITPMPGKDY